MKSRHLNRKKKTGDERSRTTDSGYADALDFFLSIARCDRTDPRCLEAGVESGSPWRVDDPTTPVGEQDLLFGLEVRASTDLGVRRSNQVAMETWGRAVAAELKHATVEARTPDLPDQPRARGVMTRLTAVDASTSTF